MCIRDRLGALGTHHLAETCSDEHRTLDKPGSTPVFPNTRLWRQEGKGDLD